MHRARNYGPPRFDIADIVRAHRGALQAQYTLSRPQKRVLSAIAKCRTAALGGHIDYCETCGYSHPAYNSCRNRHCPKCQALTQQKWIEARTERLLPVAHFHLVFTLPSELRALAKARPRALFHALFAAASETLHELAKSRMQASLGITMVLHTWTRDVRFHPHVHALVTAGGLKEDQSGWQLSHPRYLFPIAIMGKLLRGKMMAALHRLYDAHVFDGFEDFDDPEGFDRMMIAIARKSWLVYAKKPFRKVTHVLEYLGRYTHRVAISNSRLCKVTSQHVTFSTKNGERATLSCIEFLRRFVQHVLPDAFHKIRHYGLYAGAHSESLEHAHQLLGTAPRKPKPSLSWAAQLRQVTGRDVGVCPRCGGRLQSLPVARPSARAPPSPLAVAS